MVELISTTIWRYCAGELPWTDQAGKKGKGPIRTITHVSFYKDLRMC